MTDPFFQAIVDHIDIGIALIGADMRVQWMNAQMKAWFPDVDIDGKPLCYEVFHKPGEDAPCTNCPTAQTLDDGQRHEALVSRELDGKLRYFRIHSTPRFDEEGRKTSAIEMVTDISEAHLTELALRNSELKYRSLIDNLNIGVYRNTAGAEGHFLQANPAVAAIFGYDSVEEFMRTTVAESYEHPDERHAFLDRLMKEGHVRNQELRLKKRDGTPMWCSCTATVSYDPDGYIRWIDGVIEDITERKLIEEERSQFASRLLDTQEKERKNISAYLHDHLGQLLTLARIEIASISKQDDSEQAVAVALKRIDEVLDSLRDMALSLRPPLLDDLGLAPALDTLAEEFSATSGVEVTCDLCADLPRLEQDAETCLYRIAQEALTNVAKHAGARQAEVKLDVRDGHIELCISDDGHGRPSTFGHSANRLGLIGMRERLLRCNGQLDVRDRLPHGTMVCARIPLTAREEGALL